MTQPQQKTEQTCQHNEVYIVGERDKLGNPEGEKRLLYYVNCLNPDCGTNLLEDLRNYKRTEEMHQNLYFICIKDKMTDKGSK